MIDHHHESIMDQAMAERNASIEEGAEASRKLLAAKAQEVADLTCKASAEEAAANKALSELEGLRAEDKREARRQLAEKAEQVAAAEAAAREAEERIAEDAGEVFSVFEICACVCVCFLVSLLDDAFRVAAQNSVTVFYFSLCMMCSTPVVQG